MNQGHPALYDGCELVEAVSWLGGEVLEQIVWTSFECPILEVRLDGAPGNLI